MKHIILVAMVLLAASVATVTAEDAPSIWMEQNDNTIALMVNTSADASGVNAWVHFAPAVLNITDVDVSMSPWQPMTGTGWSHQGDHVVIALTDFDGVAAGEYQVATMDIDCIAAGSSMVTIDHAEPGGIMVHNLAYVCADDPPEPEPNATIAIGNATGDATIPITISDADNVGAVDVTLSYDPTVVNVTLSDGDMDCTYTNVEYSADGWVRIGAVQGDNPGLSDFDLMNVTLTPLTTGASCALEITVTTFKDATPNCTAMTYTVVSGTYTTPEPTPSPDGDANNDGTTDIVDAVYIARHVLGITGYEDINGYASNVNRDNVLDMADSMYLTKHVMGDPDFATLG